jgi:hypothetical protein
MVENHVKNRPTVFRQDREKPVLSPLLNVVVFTTVVFCFLEILYTCRKTNARQNERSLAR